jgi:membrane-bound inhibitor of C-type lysozyme
MAGRAFDCRGLGFEDEMTLRNAASALAAIFAMSVLAYSPAPAQTFHTYRCVDGTRFILAFYPYDKRVYVQVDGQPVVLRRSLTSPAGRRYSGGGVTLVFTGSGTTIRHMRRPVTACEISSS